MDFKWPNFDCVSFDYGKIDGVISRFTYKKDRRIVCLGRSDWQNRRGHLIKVSHDGSILDNIFLNIPVYAIIMSKHFGFIGVTTEFYIAFFPLREGFEFAWEFEYGWTKLRCEEWDRGYFCSTILSGQDVVKAAKAVERSPLIVNLLGAAEMLSKVASFERSLRSTFDELKMNHFFSTYVFDRIVEFVVDDGNFKSRGRHRGHRHDLCGKCCEQGRPCCVKDLESMEMIEPSLEFKKEDWSAFSYKFETCEDN
jgi:hypothetical protein